MEHLLSVGAVVLATTGAACCTARRRPDWLVVAAMGIMLLAMVDTMLLGSAVLRPLVWAGLLATSAAGVAVSRFHAPQVLERTGHLAAMALLTAAMGTGANSAHGHSMPGMSSVKDMSGQAAAAQPSAMAVLGLTVVIALAYWWSLLLVVRSAGSTGLVRAERLSGGASLLTMAIMVGYM